MACVDLIRQQIDLPSMGCAIGADPYRRKLRLLLRVGDLWELPDGGVFDRLLLSLAEEYSRLHFAICKLAEDAPFSVGPLHRWRLVDYEHLLAAHGVEAQVTDHNCDILTTDNADCDSRIWDERFVYYIIITVADLNSIPYPPDGYELAQKALNIDDATADSRLWDDYWRRYWLEQNPLLQCLYEYRQSHTAFMFREHPYWSAGWDIDALNTNNATTDSAIYDRPWHSIRVTAHPSFKLHELAAYLEQPLGLRDETYPAGAITQRTLYDTQALNTDNATTDSTIYDRAWHAIAVIGQPNADLPRIFEQNRIYFDTRQWQEPLGVQVNTVYDYPALTVANATTDNAIYEQDWHHLIITLPEHYSTALLDKYAAELGLRPYTRITTQRSAWGHAHQTRVLFATHEETETLKTYIHYHWEALPHAPH